MKAILAIFLVFLGLQCLFWYRTHMILPDMTIVPEVPGVETVKALSLGDEHAFFRFLGLQLQNAGDTFGRFTALSKYDYNKLYHWFRVLDALDNDSNYIPSMATYYYSQTQNVPDVQYVVDYLVEHGEGRVEQKWWWLVQAAYLANHKLKDKPQALKIAQMLRADAKIPVWARQMPAFIYEQQGEMDAALKIIESVLEHSDEIEQGELNFISHFVEERLGKMEEIQDQIERKRIEAKDKKSLQGSDAAEENSSDNARPQMQTPDFVK